VIGWGRVGDKLMMIVPDAITIARAGANTGLLWAGWTALNRWRRW
jgi:hypothetical protein